MLVAGVGDIQIRSNFLANEFGFKNLLNGNVEIFSISSEFSSKIRRTP